MSCRKAAGQVCIPNDRISLSEPTLPSTGLVAPVLAYAVAATVQLQPGTCVLLPMTHLSVVTLALITGS